MRRFLGIHFTPHGKPSAYRPLGTRATGLAYVPGGTLGDLAPRGPTHPIYGSPPLPHVQQYLEYFS